MYRNTHPLDLYRHLRFDMGWKHTHLFPTHNVDLDVNEKDIPCNSIGVLQFKNFQFNVKWHYMYVNRCSRGEVLTCESIWTATCKVIHFIHTESFIQTWRRAALIHLCLTHQAFQRQNITQDTQKHMEYHFTSHWWQATSNQYLNIPIRIYITILFIKH